MLISSTKSSRSSSSSSSSSLSSLSFIFPTDLLIEILKRVPLKTLIRATCVSKSWQSLLTSPSFISAHISHNTISPNSNPNPNFRFHLFKPPIDLHTSSPAEFLVLDTQSALKPRKIKSLVGKNHFVVSSCDGLLCFFDFYAPNPSTTPLVLWNPSIKRVEVVRVPVDHDVEVTPGGFPKLIFGVGLNHVGNEYNVVRVAYYNNFCGSTRFCVDVYGIGSGEWRGLGTRSVARNFSTIRWRGVCLNGVIHWVGNCNVNVNESFDDGGGSKDLVLRSILTFRLGCGSFGEIELPKEVSRGVNETVRLITVRRSCNEVLGVMHKFGECLSLWVMEKYGSKDSWVNLFCVKIGNVGGSDVNVGLISEEAVAVQMWSGNWILHDVRTDEKKSIRQMPRGVMYVDAYVESLILLGQGSFWPRKK